MLDHVGRHGRLYMSLGALIGLLLPPLASLAAPLLLPALLVTTVVALVRVDWRMLRGYAARPRLLLPMLLGSLLLSPLLVAATLHGLALPDSLRAAMVLVAASAPIFANAAFALILGLDAALATVICVAATALVPFTMPPLALALLGVSLNIDALALGLRLGGVVGGAFLIAWVIRRWTAPQTLQRHAHALDGSAVLAALLFVLAIMDGMTALAIEQPVFVLTVTVAALLFNLLLQALGLLLAWPFGARIAVTTAMIFGNCNMGLVMVALGSQADAQMQAFFAFGQLPMYILPAVMLPLYRWIVAAADARSASKNSDKNSAGSQA